MGGQCDGGYKWLFWSELHLTLVVDLHTVIDFLVVDCTYIV